MRSPAEDAKLLSQRARRLLGMRETVGGPAVTATVLLASTVALWQLLVFTHRLRSHACLLWSWISLLVALWGVGAFAADTMARQSARGSLKLLLALLIAYAVAPVVIVEEAGEQDAATTAER